MKVVITGATGFIGRHLCTHLLKSGHEIIVLTRNTAKAIALLSSRITAVEWQSRGSDDWKSAIAGSDAIVNLAGENLSSGRWTKRKRAELLESRLASIRAIGEVVTADSDRPATVIQASAVGFYGPRPEEELSEGSEGGIGYLAEIASKCESEAEALASGTRRIVSIRTGIVLGRDGGILPLLLTPLRFGFGGFPGNGLQWLSWIHIDDEIRAIRHLLDRPQLHGAFNLTSPAPILMRDFVRAAGRLLHRPVWVPLPAPVLRIAFGEMADEALLTGQRAVPTRLLESGFVFDHPSPDSALRALFSPS